MKVTITHETDTAREYRLEPENETDYELLHSLDLRSALPILREPGKDTYLIVARKP